MTRPSRLLKQGIYVPTVAFFTESDEVDIPTTKKHAVHLAAAGVAGITVQGSNGEAVHLDREERNSITAATRSALDENGFASVPVIVGCGAQSTRETIRLCRDAAEAGGDYVLVLPPCYYKSMMTRDVLLQFFRDVADASPLPVLIYNYPGAVAGIDLDSDDVIALAQHDNIVGIKLTCGNTGKLARIASAVAASGNNLESDSSNGIQNGNSSNHRFVTFGGSADFTLQTLVAGGDGVIAGVANLIPRACVKLMQLYQDGKVEEAQKLQSLVAKADWVTIRTGFVGVKAALEAFWGYEGCEPRRPCVRLGAGELERLKTELKEAVEVENKL